MWPEATIAETRLSAKNQSAAQSKPMKIGYVVKRFPRFSETFILNEILALEKQGVEVEVFALMEAVEDSFHEQLSAMKAPVFYLNDQQVVNQWKLQTGIRDQKQYIPVSALLENQTCRLNEAIFPAKSVKKSMSLHNQAMSLALLAMARGIQHLHAHFASEATGVALIASRISRIGYSFTAHAKDIYHVYVDEQIDRELLKTKINESLFVLTVSEYNRRYLASLVDPDQHHKIIRLYNGVDQNHFFPPVSPKRRNEILAVGRLVEKKGFRFLIDACALLNERKADFQCTIIGHGEERENLQQQINVLGLNQFVHLVGPQTQSELMQTMQQAAALVLPAIVTATGDRDGLPTVLLEAKAMGMPVISTTVAGIPEIIDHDRTGYLVPPEDPEPLANAIEKLLQDPDKALEMGRAGRKKAETLFNLEKNNKELFDFFKRAIDVQPLHNRI